jgi:hypothetical protein
MSPTLNLHVAAPDWLNKQGVLCEVRTELRSGVLEPAPAQCVGGSVWMDWRTSWKCRVVSSDAVFKTNLTKHGLEETEILEKERCEERKNSEKYGGTP